MSPCSRFAPLVAGLLLLAALAPAATAQIIDNKGTDFYLPFQPNFDASGFIEVHLTADVATNVTVQFPVNAPTFTTTVPVTPGTITVVLLPIAAAEGWRTSPATARNNVARAFAPAEFVAYMINRRNFSSDAALALPVDALNTEYLIQTFTPAFAPSQFVVAAAFDNTTVTITPKRALQGGRPANTPFSVTLNRGEGVAALSQVTSGISGDLSGSLVTSDRPVVVSQGEGCAQIPNGTAFCDHIFEIAQPTASWGNEVLVSPLANRPNGSIYRVMAAQDGTTLQLNGATVAALDKGQFYSSGSLAGAHVFSADKPIFVTQFMTGSNSPGATQGDPASGNLVPTEQYLSAYTFSTVGDGQFRSHFLNVIAENSDVAGGTIRLDGVAVPAAAFTPIGTTGFSWARVPLAEGTHTTSSSGVHGIMVSGYNADDSYLYPGGALFQFINQGTDETAPICAGTINGSIFNGTASDTPAADPDNTGIFFVALAPGSDNLTLTVSPFTPGDPTVSYTVSLTDPNANGSGVVVVTDGAGNTCRTPIQLQGSGTPQDTTPPVCGPIAFDMSGPGRIFSTISDPESGIASVRFTLLNNLTGRVDAAGPFAVGDTYLVPGAPTSIELSGVRINTAVRRAGLLAVITNGAGLQSTCDPVVAELGATADQTALGLPAPNPLRTETRIPFGLAEAAYVRLVIYDAVGREVARLVDAEMGAGQYALSWDGSDGFGRSLASGVYVVRFEAGTVAETRRISVVR